MRANSRIVKFGCSTLVQTIGDAPYTWSIEGLGSLEEVSPRLQKFKAPNVIDAGKTIVKCSRMVAGVLVVDQITVAYGSHLHVLADIVKHELSLEDDQVVLNWENFKIPSDRRAYVNIGGGSGRPLGNNRVGNDQVIQSINMIDDVTIECYGLGQSTQYFSGMAMLALNSAYAEKQVVENSMKIISLPAQMTNVSAAEGSSGLKRFVGTFNVFYNLIKSKEEDYYDTFSDIQILERP